MLRQDTPGPTDRPSSRRRALAELERLPDPLRRLEHAPQDYRPEVTPALRALAEEIDRTAAA